MVGIGKKEKGGRGGVQNTELKVMYDGQGNKSTDFFPDRRETF